jgi:hypothetical protein
MLFLEHPLLAVSSENICQFYLFESIDEIPFDCLILT